MGGRGTQRYDMWGGVHSVMTCGGGGVHSVMTRGGGVHSVMTCGGGTQCYDMWGGEGYTAL